MPGLRLTFVCEAEWVWHTTPRRSRGVCGCYLYEAALGAEAASTRRHPHHRLRPRCECGATAVGRARWVAGLRLSPQCNAEALQPHSPPALWCLWAGGCLLGQPRWVRNMGGCSREARCQTHPTQTTPRTRHKQRAARSHSSPQASAPAGRTCSTCLFRGVRFFPAHVPTRQVLPRTRSG